MTAIEKMLNRLFTPEEKPDNSARIRETLRMSSAMRETLGALGNARNTNKPNEAVPSAIKEESRKEDISEIL